VECTFYSNSYGRISGIDHTLGNKISLNLLRSIALNPLFFSNCTNMKLDINKGMKLENSK
jgi:hypothetical protein